MRRHDGGYNVDLLVGDRGSQEKMFVLGNVPVTRIEETCGIVVSRGIQWQCAKMWFSWAGRVEGKLVSHG